MRRRHVLLPALVLGPVPLEGAVTTAVLAEPPEIAMGTVLVDPLSFRLAFDQPAGPVERFGGSLRVTVSGELAGQTSGSFDCRSQGRRVTAEGVRLLWRTPDQPCRPVPSHLRVPRGPRRRMSRTHPCGRERHRAPSAVRGTRGT